MPSSNVCWGLDIGAGAIKAIKLERDGDSVAVGDFVVIPHKKVLTTPDLDEADAIRVALGALMAEYGESMKGQHVAVSVAGHSSFARFAKLPPVEPKGVADLVKFEAAQQIPFPIEEVEWDYQVFVSEDTPDLEAGIFAITKERIHERLTLYRDLGLSPDTLTISPVAVYNAVAYDLAFTENSPGTIILDIGAAATDLIIAEGGKVWIRTFPLGGHHFTEVLAETFKLNYTKAEKLKREAETSKYKRHIFQALRPIFSDLVQDVQRSIGYYQDTHPDAELTRLIGLGSTFKLMGLRKLLSQQLKLEVFRLERFKQISVDGPGAADFEAASLAMATAYGLALQGLGMTPINANLMPISVLRGAMWKRKTPWFVTAAAIGVVGAGAAFIRPVLDGQGLAPVSSDREIQNIISKGNKFKREWQEIKDANQPEFPIDNVIGLLDRKDLQFHILEDVSAMLAVAGARTTAPTAGFTVRSLTTSYIPPEGPIELVNAKADAGADAGDRGRSGPAASGRGGRGASDAEAGAKAGPFGAVEVTLELDSANPAGGVFFNDTILAWMRQGPDATRRPYTLVEVPTIENVQREPLGGLSATGSPGRQEEPSSRPRRGPRNPFGSPPDSPGRPMPSDAPSRGAPRGGSSGASGPSVQRIEALAPLKDPDPVFAADAAVTRYTLRFTLQLLEAPPGVPDGEADPEAAIDGSAPAPVAQHDQTEHDA